MLQVSNSVILPSLGQAIWPSGPELVLVSQSPADDNGNGRLGRNFSYQIKLNSTQEKCQSNQGGKIKFPYAISTLNSSKIAHKKQKSHKAGINIKLGIKQISFQLTESRLR